MRRGVHLILVGLVGVMAVIGIVTGPDTSAAAQHGDDSCRALYFETIANLLTNCGEMMNGSICWGTGEVAIETTSGPVMGGPGSVIPFGVVTGVSIPPGEDSVWSLATAHLVDTVNYENYTTLLLLGPLEMAVDIETPLPGGAAFTLTNGAEPTPCSELPHPGVLVQSAEKSLTLLRVNGVDLAINGTAVLQVPDGDGLTVSAISRETILGNGTVVFAGYSVTVADDGTVSTVEPYDPQAVAYLPTETLPRLEVVPVPGNAFVREAVPLHFRPAVEAYSSTVVKAGLPVNILGQDSTRAWLHIRTYEGYTGWVPVAYLQDVTLTVEPPTYDESPPPPSRPFGPLQAQGVTTAEYNRLRAGPGLTYDEVAMLPLHTELNVFARSPDNEWLLVEIPDGTRGWISVTLFGATTDYNLDEMPYSPDYLPE